MPGSRSAEAGELARPPRNALLSAGRIAVAMALIALPARAKPLDPTDDGWEGLSQLIAMARSEVPGGHVIVAQRLDLGRLEATDALVLVHPEREIDPDELSAFMRSGGRVILMDDYGTGDVLLEHFGIRRVPLPERPNAMLRSNPVFAVADAVGVHPVVRNVERVVTNHATGLSDDRLAPLLVVRGRSEDVVLAVAGVVGQGRLVAVGDASVAMNAMLRYPGNLEFAHALIRFAADAAVPPDGHGHEIGTTARTGKLYFLIGDFTIQGRYGGSFRTDPSGAVGRIAAEAIDVLRGGLPPNATYVLAVALGLGVVFWAGTRAGRTYKRSTSRFTRPVSILAQGGIAGHAAALSSASAGTSRLLALVELRNALEEQLATRLGLDRIVAHDQLIALALAAGLLDAERAKALGALLKQLARFQLPLPNRRQPRLGRASDAELREALHRVRGVLAAVDAQRHGTLSGRS